MTPSSNTQAVHGNVTSQVGTGGARRVPVAPPNATGDGPPPAINVSLGGFLLLFVASHLLYLVLMDPVHLVLYTVEEPYRGAIAQELLTGLTMPFTEYRADNYSGGSLVIGALAAGFFLLFGPTLFALKLAPLLLFTLALAFWYWTIQRAAGERVAGYFALLFCFSPPLLTAYSVAAPGGHGESLLFSALTVFLLFRMLSDERGSPAFPALLGLTAGVGLWFDYIYGLTLLALLGVWLWQDTRMLWRTRFACFALGFLVGFSPWIVIDMQTHFAGLVIHGKNVWEHFRLAYLWEGMAHPRKLAPFEFFADIASDDPRDLPRRVVNVLYSLLYLGPLLIAGILRLKTWRSGPAGVNDSGRGPRETRPSRTHPTQPTLVGFGILYVVVFALAVQFSDFKATRYHLPAYPFLFLFVALSLVRCQEAFPNVQKKIQTVFLASVVVLGLGTHAPLFSLDRPGAALSAKGYSYALMPNTYSHTHAPAGKDDHNFIPQMVQRPFLSDILPKLSGEDQRDLSRAIALLLSRAAPLNGQAEEFSRIEQLIPPGFDPYFYYSLGGKAMSPHAKELAKAVAEVEFLRHRSPLAHHLALVGIYRSWPEQFAFLDASPEALVNHPGAVDPKLSPHYWRAVGHQAGHYWHNTEHSLGLLDAHLHAFLPNLSPSVQRYVLQGVGTVLFHHHGIIPFPPAEIEQSLQAYQQGLLEGWGMALRDLDYLPLFPWQGSESLYWMASTKGLSARSLIFIQQGQAQLDALFQEPAASALKPPRHAP